MLFLDEDTKSEAVSRAFETYMIYDIHIEARESYIRYIVFEISVPNTCITATSFAHCPDHTSIISHIARVIEFILPYYFFFLKKDVNDFFFFFVSLVVDCCLVW